MTGGKESVGKQVVIIAILGALGLALLSVSQQADKHFKQSQAKAETAIQQGSVNQEKK